MIVKLLTERHLEFLSFKGGCNFGSSKSSSSKCQFVGNLMAWLIFCLSRPSNKKISRHNREMVKKIHGNSHIFYSLFNQCLLIFLPLIKCLLTQDVSKIILGYLRYHRPDFIYSCQSSDQTTSNKHIYLS